MRPQGGWLGGEMASLRWSGDSAAREPGVWVAHPWVARRRRVCKGEGSIDGLRPRHQPGHALRWVWTLSGVWTLSVVGCGPSDCPMGSVRSVADGLCYLLPGEPASAPDTGGPTSGAPVPGDSAAPLAGDTGDGTVEEPQPVSDNCDIPSALPVDPITELGTFNLQDEAFAEAVDIEVDSITGVAILAGQGGLMLVDITDAAAPDWVGHDGDETFRQRYQNLELGVGGVVYATNWDEGLAVYDIHTGDDPTLVYALETEGLAGLARRDDILYVVNQKSLELEVWDVARPDRPSRVTTVGGLGAPYAPFLSGDHLYVADNAYGIVVYDVSNAELPVSVGNVVTDASVQDLAATPDGSTLFAAAGGAGIQVYSLDDPSTPTLVDTIEQAYSVISVAVGDGLLWSVDQQLVTALDIAEPRVPVVLNSHRTGQWSMHVAAVGERAWVADWGYLRGYAASGLPVGDLNPSSRTVYVAPEGDSVTVELLNAGGDELRVTGVSAADPRVSWVLDDGRIPAGVSRSLVLEYEGEGVLETSVCIASTDPDAPQQELAVVTGVGGGRTGVGVEAPDFALEDLEGNVWRLSDLRGHPVVLAYFATW